MKLSYLAIFLVCVSVNAQKIRPFFGGSMFLEHHFNAKLFLEFETGSEFRITNYLKPEVQIAFMIGSPNTKTTFDEKGIVNTIFDSQVSALNISFCPKIALGDESVIHILPKYTYSSIEAKGDFVTINNTTSKSVRESEITKQIQHSFGIGIGIEFQFSDKNSDSMYINVYLNRINLGAPLMSLKHNLSEYNTVDNFGFGLKYYFSFKKK
jgi:hypothetical protein